MKPDFANEVLNSLSAHIAVLDARGSVVAVNDAWRCFARQNGGDDKAFYVGANYLTACEEAIRCGGDEVAEAVLNGIRDLLSGNRTRFSVEYPCHSPGVQRWFSVHVSRFSHKGATYLLTAHEDITARKVAEEKLYQASMAIDAMNRELQQVLAREQLKARTDDLTGLHNRRHFFALSQQLISLARRYRMPLSVFICDIDHFKRINDVYGHQVGDAILKRVAQIARQHMRSSDVLARYGGEELIVTLPNTSAHEALIAAEHLRESIAASREIVDNREVTVTISVGVAEMMADEGTLDGVIQRADQALYAAKNAGRNCSKIFSQPVGPG